MKTKGVTRLIMICGSGLAVPEVPLDWEDGDNPMLNTINILRRDYRKVWQMIDATDLYYTLFCPGNFPSGPRSENYITAVNSKPGPEVTTGMVADAVCKELVKNEFLRCRVGISAKP